MVKKRLAIEPRKPPVAKTRGTQEHSDAPASARPLKTVVRRQDGRELKKLNVYISVKVAAELDAYCMQSGRNAGHVVNEAIETLLARR
jgi:hypothetical protein